jgi:hypothetical protein
LPNAGGGGAEDYCETHPEDEDCAEPGGLQPDRVARNRVQLAGMVRADGGPWGDVKQSAIMSLPPCDEPLPSPAPTPVPLIPLPEPITVATILQGQLVAQLPPFEARVNPLRGLVNLESWFWVEGYDGREYTASESFSSPPYVGDLTIEVRLYPRLYEWDFGDRSSYATGDKEGLGQRAAGGAQPSTVRHTYSAARPGDGYPVLLTIEWAVEYRVNGGDPLFLSVVARTGTVIHPVQEVAPIIVR